MQFSGKVAIVTGAARGIGAATAKAFAAAGAAVVINDILDAQPLAGELRAQGCQALFVKADVADQAQVDATVRETVKQFGRLDIFVSSAVFSERGPFHEIPMDQFERTIAVSMWGPFYGVRAAAVQMLKQGGGGCIVVISSPHAVIPVAGAMAYNMAKAAVDQMARTAATELFPHRIRVNIVHPGWVDTPGERKFYTEETIERLGKLLPWRRLARPEEIARGVLFLASAESDYVTGSTLTIDGGIQLPWTRIH